MQGKRVVTMLVAVLIAVILLLYLFMFQVRSNEVAIVLTFGKASPEKIEPGVHFQAPWPIQIVRRFDNSLHVNETKMEQQYTRDRHSLITSVCVGWKIADVARFNENFGRLGAKSIEEAWVSLEKQIRDKTNASLGRYELRDLVSADPTKLKYEEIESQTRDEVVKDAKDLYGIDLVLLRIKRLELPESVRRNVYDRMREERNKEAKEIENRGKQVAANIKDRAESYARTIRAQANSMAYAIKGEGEKEAAKHYEVLASNPELAIYLRRLEAMERVAKKEMTLILDAGTPPWDVLIEKPPRLSATPAEGR